MRVKQREELEGVTGAEERVFGPEKVEEILDNTVPFESVLVGSFICLLFHGSFTINFYLCLQGKN